LYALLQTTGGKEEPHIVFMPSYKQLEVKKNPTSFLCGKDKVTIITIKQKEKTIIDSIKKYSQELQHKTELDRKLGKRVFPT